MLKAVDAIARCGITLEVGTFKQLLEVNEANSDSWMPLTTTFRWDIGGEDEKSGVVFIGCDAQGVPVAAQAARQFDWQGTNFKEEAQSLRFYYADPQRQKAPEETCVVTASAATEITGSVGLSGALWFRPDDRRLMLPAILPPIARAYALTTWDIDAMMTIITTTNIERGLHKKNRFRDISWEIQISSRQLTLKGCSVLLWRA